MHAYSTLVTELSLPNRVVRLYVKHKWEFGRKYFKEILFTLTELVEKAIARVMAGKSGDILHDGWKY